MGNVLALVVSGMELVPPGLPTNLWVEPLPAIMSTSQTLSRELLSLASANLLLAMPLTLNSWQLSLLLLSGNLSKQITRLPGRYPVLTERPDKLRSWLTSTPKPRLDLWVPLTPLPRKPTLLLRVNSELLTPILVRPKPPKVLLPRLHLKPLMSSKKLSHSRN